jgi:hypothetical protein
LTRNPNKVYIKLILIYYSSHSDSNSISDSNPDSNSNSESESDSNSDAAESVESVPVEGILDPGSSPVSEADFGK